MGKPQLFSPVLLGLFIMAASAAGAGESHPPIDYRALKIEDFPVRAHVPAKVDAYTHVLMSYHMEQKTVQDGNMWRSEVVLMDIHCTMYPDKSWRRGTLKDPNSTLEHEQGHFDLCEGKARKLRMQTLSSYPVGRGSDRAAAEADLNHVLNAYFTKRYGELTKEQHKYDKETKVGKAAPRQKTWSERLQKSVHE